MGLALLTRTRTLATIVVSLCLGTGFAGAADAATFETGEMTVKFDSALINAASLRLTADRNTKLKNGSATFGLTQGEGSLKTPFSATAKSDALLRLRRGGGSRAIRFGAPIPAVKKGKLAFYAYVSERAKWLNVFEATGKSKVKTDSGFGTLGAKSAPVALTSAGASAFNAALGVKTFRKGMRGGTITFKLVRDLVAAADGGSIAITYDRAFVEMLDSCGTDYAPANGAEALPVSEAAPNGGIRMAPTRGWHFYRPTTGLFLIQPNGILSIRKAVGYTLKGVAAFGGTLQRAGFVDFFGREGFASLVGGTFTPRVTATGGTVDIEGAQLTLSDAGAQQMASLECTAPRGLPIGALRVTVVE